MRVAAVVLACVLTSGLLYGSCATETNSTPPSPPPPPPPSPPGAVGDPTQLPAASGQAPNNAAYAALNVPARPAGYSYNDPVTAVRIWKASSGTVPIINLDGIGHDYADGGNQISLGWGANEDSYTILLLPNGVSNDSYYLVDFTRGVGFSNYRHLTVQPQGDLAATFSNLRSQPRILYILTGTQLVRYNTATMRAENTGFFPLATTAGVWLHQDKDDTRFALTNYSTHTGYAWNSRTNQLLSHSEAWMDEMRMERDGRYAVFSSVTTVRVWDLSDNTFGAQQADPNFWFGHIASIRGRWVTEDPNAAIPYGTDRYDIVSKQVTRTNVLSSGVGNLANYSGNWVQSDSELGGDLNKQWAVGVGWGDDDSRFAWRQAIGFVRADGSDQRLLLHHYSSLNPTYYASPWATPSPDGKIVIFNSDMQGSGRWDLFVAEVPVRTP